MLKKLFPLILAVFAISHALAIPIFAQSQSAVPAQTQPKDKPIVVPGKAQASRRIDKAAPYYPLFAREHHIEGTVILHAIISKKGRISHVEVVSSRYNVLTEASLDAVNKFRYTPTLINGEPVEVDTTITITFEVH